MLIDEARTRELLHRIVCRLTSDTAIKDDLLQEALVHLWLLEEKHPGQSRSWYLQGCKFHLQNYLAMGRSVDSMKRRSHKLSFSTDCDEIDEFISESNWGVDTAFDQVSVRDIIAQLSERLPSFEQAVLSHLAEGLRAREVAARLKVSHPTIIKHRRKIAALAIKLGIPPLPKYRRTSALIPAE